MKLKSKLTLKTLVTLGMFTALSVILVMFTRTPIFAVAPYLEYDAADIPIFITAFMYGPAAGLVLTVAVSLIQSFTVSASSGPIGLLMHIMATGSFVITAGLIYKRRRTVGSAVLALAAGTVVMALTMALWNIIITPLFATMPRQDILNMILPVFIPFNLIKAGANSIITFIAYKPLSKFLKKRGGL